MPKDTKIDAFEDKMSVHYNRSYNHTKLNMDAMQR